MTTTGREYAEALFELAAEENSIAETGEGLAMVNAVMAETPAWRAMLSSPAIPRETRLGALDEALRGRVPDILMGVLRMMISRGHAGALDEMAREYDQLARDARGEAMARVTSAVPLSGSEQEKLKERLEKKFQRKITLQCTVDPSLLGGIRAEVEGTVIDGSIKNKLDQIKEVMHS